MQSSSFKVVKTTDKKITLLTDLVDAFNLKKFDY